MLDFGLMEVEGFSSIISEKFYWDLRGLNIIQAPNGFGKTTFINALVWSLYGKTLSGSVEPWEHTKSSSYKGTRVSIEFCVNGQDCKVVRYKGYSKVKNDLIVYCNKVELEGSKPELNKKIIDITGYTYDLFKNSIIFGQKLKRIISETGPNKKKVFDDAFQISYIPIAKRLAEKELNEYRSEYTKQQRVVDKLNGEVNSKESEINSQELLLKSFDDNKIKDIEIEKEAIKELNQQLKGINIKDIESKLTSIKGENLLLEKDCLNKTDILTLEKTLVKTEINSENEKNSAGDLLGVIEEDKDMLNNLPTKCEHCGRKYSENDKLKEKTLIEERIAGNEKEYTIKIDNHSKSIKVIKELKSRISSANKVLDAIESNNEEIRILESKVSKGDNIKEKIEIHKKNIETIKARKLENHIEKLRDELGKLNRLFKKEKKQLGKMGRDVKTYEWLIKDPLSNSGIRAFIFNRMLDEINERLEYYTKYINLQAAFVMDMGSANKDMDTFVFSNGEIVPYDDLSGGQQQAVDLVTAFSIHDVVSDTKNCSLFVMDEVFESLDRNNIEVITELINDMAKEKCLYLITHRSEFNPINSNVINLGFDGKNTTILT